jgi:uncharacterized protein YdcH (DUF465 family)
MNIAMADRVQALEQQHRNLAQQVYQLERRAYLTPFEQRRVSDLKKMKLLAKDQLASLRREER